MVRSIFWVLKMVKHLTKRSNYEKCHKYLKVIQSLDTFPTFNNYFQKCELSSKNVLQLNKSINSLSI